MVVNPITIGKFAFIFICTPVGRTSDYDVSDLKTYLLMKWSGPDVFSVVGPPGLPVWFFSFALVFSFLTVESLSLLYLRFIF